MNRRQRAAPPQIRIEGAAKQVHWNGFSFLFCRCKSIYASGLDLIRALRTIWLKMNCLITGAGYTDDIDCYLKGLGIWSLYCIWLLGYKGTGILGV